MPNVDKKCVNNSININKKHIVSLFRWHYENTDLNSQNQDIELKD